MERIIMLDNAGTGRDGLRRTASAMALLVARLGGVEVDRCAVPNCEICNRAVPEAA